MIAGMILFVVGFGLPTLAEFVPASLRAGYLLATFPLAGLGGALTLVNTSPFLMGSTSPQERNHVFSVMLALSPLAGFIGSLVGGLLPRFFATMLDVSLDRPAPYRYPLLIAAAFLIPAVLVLLATREVGTSGKQETVTKASPLGRAVQSPRRGEQATPYGLIALLALVGLLRVTGENAARTFLYSTWTPA